MSLAKPNYKQAFLQITEIGTINWRPIISHCIRSVASWSSNR